MTGGQNSVFETTDTNIIVVIIPIPNLASATCSVVEIDLQSKSVLSILAHCIAVIFGRVVRFGLNTGALTGILDAVVFPVK